MHVEIILGGSGLNEGSCSNITHLRVGDKATFGVKMPRNLIVVSDSLCGEITGLMPSSFWPDMGAATRCIQTATFRN